MFKYKVGDLVKVSPEADGYDRFYDDFEVEVDELGLVIECIDKHSIIPRDKNLPLKSELPESCRLWYKVLFGKSRKELDFEEWELEPLW